jgi:uncharacterized protein YbjT (DUF2867 family)
MNTSNTPITLIFGARGQIGGELARLLQDDGHAVLRATHGPATEQDQAHIDLGSGTGIDAAFARAQRAFLLCPPGFTRQDLLLAPAIESAVRHGLNKVVLMTAMGADADPESPLRRAELQLERSGLAYTVLRPNWFMQNFHNFWLHSILAEGRIKLPVGSAKGSFIDTRDIAAVAAKVLGDSAHNGRAYDLTGAEALDHDQIAALLSEASGRAIRFEDISPEAMRAGLLAAGLPADYADFLLTILGYFKQGYAERITTSVQDILGRSPIGFADHAREFRQVWAR